MAVSAWFRGEGGGLHEFALPLPDVYAQQERAGRLTRVDPPTPAPAVEPVAEPAAEADTGEVERPSRADSKADWVAWAHHVSKRPTAELEEMTKAALIAEYGGD